MDAGRCVIGYEDRFLRFTLSWKEKTGKKGKESPKKGNDDGAPAGHKNLRDLCQGIGFWSIWKGWPPLIHTLPSIQP